jgi:Kef-type K+ transport system membrane component KefB
MTDSALSLLIGAGLSVSSSVLEVAVLLGFRRSNSRLSTLVVFGAFVIAFNARMVLLLLVPRLHGLGVRDPNSFGLGVVSAFLLAVGVQAVVSVSRSKTKGS